MENSIILFKDDNSIIKVIRGDITNFSFDVYVNAANNTLSGGRGVDYAIHKVAGERTLIEYNKRVNKGYLKTGEAVITPGFLSKAKYIIHTVGPIYYNHSKEENEELLFNSYYNSLSLAKKNNVHTIGFPAISQGVYGYPSKEACQVSFKAIKKWINDNKDYAMEIYLVCYLEETYFNYLELLN